MKTIAGAPNGTQTRPPRGAVVEYGQLCDLIQEFSRQIGIAVASFCHEQEGRCLFLPMTLGGPLVDHVETL